MTSSGLWGCIQDLKFAVRQWVKSPAFTITAVLTLALGIGANTAIFSLVYTLLLRSLPVSHPEQLARIRLSDPGDPQASDVGISWQMADLIRSQSRSFSDVSCWQGYVPFSMKDDQGTLRLYQGEFVTGNGFTVLGAKPLLGRLLLPSDDIQGGPTEGWSTVLSYGFWQDRFRGDLNVIGSTVTIFDTPVTIIGVLPPAFEGVDVAFSPKLYLPNHFMAVLYGQAAVDGPNLGYIGMARLRPGVTLRQANAEASTYKKRVFDPFVPPRFAALPFVKRAVFQVQSGRSGFSFLRRQLTAPLLIMQGLVGVVLLLCCTNLAGLLLARSYGRQHEFAVRAAIGAGYRRLMRQYLTESLVLAFAGSFLGLCLAWLALSSLVGFFTPAGAFQGISLKPDSSILAVTVVLAVVTTILFGTSPAWLVGRANPGSLLRARSSIGGGRSIAGKAFVPFQIGLSLILVVVSGLFIHSLQRTRSQATGFVSDGVLIVSANFQNLHQPPDQTVDLYHNMAQQLRQLPGMHAAAVTWFTPMTGRDARAAFASAGEGGEIHQDSRTAYNSVSPGYFATLQIPIISGRDFGNTDRDQSVCIVNRSAAAFFFPHREAVGQSLRSTDDENNKLQFPNPISCRIVAVVEDARFASLKEPAPRTIYLPLTKDTPALNYQVFLLRGSSFAVASAAYRKVLAQDAPSTPLLLFLPLNEQIAELLGTDRLISLLSAFFGGLALLLSGLGLYGLLATSVTRRTGEIGIRMALGAERTTVLKMILLEAARLVMVGVAFGAIGVFFASRLIRSALFETSAMDPFILIVSLLVLGTIALLAAFIPARRAATLDPMTALRSE